MAECGRAGAEKALAVCATQIELCTQWRRAEAFDQIRASGGDPGSPACDERRVRAVGRGLMAQIAHDRKHRCSRAMAERTRELCTGPGVAELPRVTAGEARVRAVPAQHDIDRRACCAE